MIDRIRLQTLHTAGAVCLMLACGGGESPPAGPTGTAGIPGLRIVSGANLADTALAQLSQTVAVEVRGANGAVAGGVPVQFDALPPADTARRSQRSLWVCATNVQRCGPGTDGNDSQSATAVTDAVGRASAIVRLGAVAGTATLVVSAPALGFRDTVRVTVRPGAAAAIRVSTRDTTLYVGGVATLRPAALDVNGNVRDDAVTASGDGAAVAEVSSAGVVTGRNVGRVRVLLRAGGATDSAFISVIPHGRLTAWVQNSAGLLLQLAMLDMDGANLRALGPAMGSWGVYPVWNRSGDRIAFHSSVRNVIGDPTHVYTIDTVGGPTLALTIAWGDRSYHPRFVSPDEVEYVMFYLGRYDVYRVRTDNSRASYLATLAEPPAAQVGAVDISPDGAQIVYSVADGTLVLFNVATSTTQRLTIRGDRPRWSPDGSQIAYRPDGRGIAVMRADGTGSRTLTSLNIGDALAWSPDGAYLLTRLAVVQPLPYLVRVSDGLAIPFAMPISIYEPSWR